MKSPRSLSFLDIISKRDGAPNWATAHVDRRVKAAGVMNLSVISLQYTEAVLSVVGTFSDKRD
jgi:hypothetical protein